MSIAPERLMTLLEVALGHGLVIRLLRQTKYEHAPRVRAMTLGDWGFAGILACLGVVLHELSPGLAVAAYFLTWLFLSLLWLDVALYGCFTFELGSAGARDVVLSNLLAEVFSMRSSRRFFAEHRAFLVVPLVLPLLWALFFLDEHAAITRALENFLAVYFFLSFSWRASWTKSSSNRRALWYDFLIARKPRIPPGFQPRPEHATLLESAISSSSNHSLHGRLQNRSILLLTFESLGTTHLRDKGAQTPFLSALQRGKNTLVSQWHATPAPLTNAAHVAWYFGQWSLRHIKTPESHVEKLRNAGYLPVYLTAAQTVHYGLADLLKQAGFAQVIDADTLRAAKAAPSTTVLDSALATGGAEQFEQYLAKHEGPFFLHIHAQNAHVPYVVEDSRKYKRHDKTDDLGRFLNALEETDALFARLARNLAIVARKRHANGDDPILVVTSDHGQSFGEHDYRSHASAVTAEQIQVPFVLHHSALPSRSISFSSHFDILPTVLDLVGISPAAGFGSSLVQDDRSPTFFLFDGQPSRPTSSCLGLLVGPDKYSLDLVRDTLVHSTWDDENPQMLEGAEREYFEALIGYIAERRGVS